MPTLAAVPVRIETPGAPEPVANGALAKDVMATRGGEARLALERSTCSQRIGWQPSLAQAALTVWALGALFVLARLALGLLRARRLVRGAHGIAVARLGRRTVEVRVSDALDTPAVTGLATPVVVLPRDALAWTEERRHVVLLHELAHVARHDCLANVVAQLACALHWYNPLVWIAARRLRIERELAADDHVLLGGARASSYAEHLLAIASTVVTSAIPAGALGMASRSQLETRIAALLARGRARAPLGRARFVALVAASGALVLAVACATPEHAASTLPSSPVSAAVAMPRAKTSAPSDDALAARRGGIPSDAMARAAAGGSGHAELTLDAALQAIAEDETDRMMADWKARAASVVVLDPATGAILALTSRSPVPSQEVAVQKAYVSGSTLKSFTIAAALEEHAVEEHQRFFCENGQRAYGKRTLHDAAPYGWLDVPQILAVSSNIGTAKIYEALGGARLGKWLTRFHFGERPSVQIANASAGAVPAPTEDAFDGAVLAIGERLTATPLQIAAGYAALANDGVYNAPTIVRRVVGDDGKSTWEHRPKPERIVSASTARAVMTMLEGVVTSEKGTGKAARVEGVRVAGKTGTADLEPEKEDGDNYASFVGAAPLQNPRYVVLVGAEAPRDQGPSARAWGGSVSAPVFARIVKRALAR